MSRQFNLNFEGGEKAPSPLQLSAESFKELKVSGQEASLMRRVLAYIREYPDSAFFEIDAYLGGYGVNNSGTLNRLKKLGLIEVSEQRVKLNPSTNRRVGVYNCVKL